MFLYSHSVIHCICVFISVLHCISVFTVFYSCQLFLDVPTILVSAFLQKNTKFYTYQLFLDVTAIPLSAITVSDFSRTVTIPISCTISFIYEIIHHLFQSATYIRYSCFISFNYSNYVFLSV